jgi:hypothetical protein
LFLFLSFLFLPSSSRRLSIALPTISSKECGWSSKLALQANRHRERHRERERERERYVVCGRRRMLAFLLARLLVCREV